MKNHLNILPKLASFDLKCSKMRWRLGLRPRPRWGSLRRSPRPPNRKRQRAFGARNSLFRVHFHISIPLSGPSLTEFLDPPLYIGLYHWPIGPNVNYRPTKLIFKNLFVLLNSRNSITIPNFPPPN